jgi:hypothetical protein
MAKMLCKSDRFGIGSALALVMLPLVAQQTLASPAQEARLEAAIYQEVVQGDLKGVQLPILSGVPCF